MSARRGSLGRAAARPGEADAYRKAGRAAARDPRVAAFLDEVLAACGGRARLRADPLAVVAGYAEAQDRELAALVCSTLAFGSVGLIMRACREALAPLGPRPAAALDAMGESEIRRAWSGFQYRYCFPGDISALMLSASRARRESGSLLAFFEAGDPGGDDVVAAASAFVRGLRGLGASGMRPGLLSDPARGSACKRLFLMLRWLVRSDGVDLGGWEAVGRRRLVVPLDTHMARVCHEKLGFIGSPAATLSNALAATEAFRLYAPEDPVRYDFALTRPGIDPEPGDERFGCP